MKPVDQIHLFQYRNYTDTTFSLGKHTLFVGPNGSGKTNVIEALRTISVTKSYRVAQDKDAIQWDQPYCRVTLKLGDESFEYVLTREQFGSKKVIKHKGSAVPLTQVYGLLPTVLFSPETMQLIDGSPQERRRFFDTILSQSDKAYIEALVTYRQVIRERHFVLLRLQQGLGSGDELTFWDSELVRTGGYLITQREAFINALNTILLELYPRFIDRNTKEQLVLHYKPSVPADELAQKLVQTRGYDIKTTTTNYGPHRDELVFVLDGRDVTLFASRGELRRAVLATKLAEAVYLQNHSEREPFILLDDVFSELDGNRRTSLLEAIKPYRTVITTTDETFLSHAKLEDSVLHQLG